MSKTTPIIVLALVLVLIGAWAIFSYSNQRYLDQNPQNQIPDQVIPGNNNTGMTDQSESGGNPAAAVLTKSDKGEGNVSISLTYITDKFVENDKGANAVGTDQFDLERNIVFLASLNTHSVDLSALKLEDLSFIKADSGEIKASGWKSAAESGHHRSGFIIFPAEDENGARIISSRSDSLTVVVRDVANIKERTFNWTLPIEYSGG